MTVTRVSNMDDAIAWIVANEHHEGYWTHMDGGRPTPSSELILVGHGRELHIPVSVHVPGAMAPSDYDVTKRMFEPA